MGGCLAAVLAILVVWVGRAGSSGAEAWLGQQLREIAGEHLVPELTFTELDYQYPRTVVLQDCRLVADDPAAPGQRIDIFAAAQLTLELAEIPGEGEPIRIERLALEQPEFRFIAISPTDGALVGYSDLVRSDPQTQPSASDDEKTSDIFQIRRIQITDGRVVYDPRTPGDPPLVLDQINLSSIIDNSAGLYAIDTRLERDPVFRLSVSGNLDLDALTLDRTNLRLDIQLGQQQQSHLPPMLQRWLHDHEVTGHAIAHVHGLWPMLDWRQSQLTMDLDLEQARLTFGRYRFPVAAVATQLRIEDQRLSIDHFDLAALGGELHLTGDVDLDADLLSRCEVKAIDVRIEEILAARTDAEAPSKLRGNLSADVQLQAPLQQWDTNMTGNGEIHLRDGRIAELPLMSAFARIFRKNDSDAKPTDVAGNRDRDRIDMTFTLAGDHIHFSSITAEATWFALRGEGRAYFDRQLDLWFNGGPLEKFQQKLGAIGAISGMVTDKLARYKVTGVYPEPKVSVALAGGKTKPRENSESVNGETDSPSEQGAAQDVSEPSEAQ